MKNTEIDGGGGSEARGREGGEGSKGGIERGEGREGWEGGREGGREVK